MNEVIYLGAPNPEQRRKDSIANPKQLYPTHQCFQDAADYVLATCFKLVDDDGTEHDAREHPPWIFNSHDRAKMAKLQKRMEAKLPPGSIRVAHGFIQAAGETILHAWVQQAGVVVETFWYQGQKVLLPMLQEQWESTLRPCDVTLYTPEQVVALHEKHDTAGPWETRYLRKTFKLGQPPSGLLPGLPTAAVAL